MTIRGAITDLGYCAAACELEAHLCPWDRDELERRAEAYRGEQLRLMAQLAQPVNTTISGFPNREHWGSRKVFA